MSGVLPYIIISNTDDLKELLCNNQKSDFVINLNESTYLLNEIDRYCIMQNVSNITIKGVNGIPTVQCVPVGSPGFGFDFVNITHLTLENLHFLGCGGGIPNIALRGFNDTHPKLLYQQKAVLMFNLCKDVIIRQVNIDNAYFGYAVLILNPFGKLDILDSTFSEGSGSAFCDSNSSSCAGSGIAVIFKDRDSKIQNDNSVEVTLKQMTIHINVNHIPRIPSLSNLVKQEACQLPIIGAGGVTAVFSQSKYFANVSIIQSTVGDINYGSVAGGMLILFYNSMQKSHVALINSNIYSGSLLPSTNQDGGAGISVHSFMCGKCSSESIRWNPIYMDTVHITGSGEATDRPTQIPKLKFGGGFYLDIHQSCEIDEHYIFMKGVAFRINYAAITGSGMYAVMRQSASIYSIVLESCESVLNTQGSASYTLYSAIATMTFVNLKNVTLTGDSFFHENYSPALAVYNTNLFIQGNMLIRNNGGSNGAAISLFHSSYLFIMPPLHATFISNRALLYGGAIYAVNDEKPGDNMCVIQLYGINNSSINDINISMNFINNTAGLAGNSIYVAPLYNCSQYNPSLAFQNINDILNATFMPSVSANGIQQVSSEPVKICYCDNSTGSKPEIQCVKPGTVIKIINTYPGKLVTLNLAAVDAMGMIVYSPVVASVTADPYASHHLSQDELTLKEGQAQVALSGSHCTAVTYNFQSRNITEVKHGFFELATPQSPPSLSAHLYVYPCPIGFMLSHGVCVCDQFITNIVRDTKCNISSLIISHPISSWLGTMTFSNTSRLGFANICPPGNCKSTAKEINVSNIENSICVDGKSGILCGKCANNLSALFGTTECKHCSNFWLFTLIFYALIGVILVIILLSFRLTLTDGPLASIIITNNIIAVSTIDYLQNDNVFISGMRIFVSLMNLNLGFPLCLYDGMTTAIKTGLQFLYPIYLWTIVIVFIILSRYSTWISNQTATSSVQVLATLIHFSFSKLLITTIDIVVFVKVKTDMNDTVTVWYEDGNMYLQDKEHIILFSLAVLTLVFFIFPYVLTVTFGAYLLRWKTFNHFRSFIESFHGPYKHNLGYWFGLRTMVIVYIYIVFTAMRGFDISLMLLFQVLALITLALVQAHMKPFRKNSLNKLDSFCLFLSVLQIVLVIVLLPDQNSPSQTLPYAIASLTSVMFCILVITLVSKSLKKLLFKKCNTQHFQAERKIYQGSKDFEEEYDEMRQALLILAD